MSEFLQGFTAAHVEGWRPRAVNHESFSTPQGFSAALADVCRPHAVTH